MVPDGLPLLKTQLSLPAVHAAGLGHARLLTLEKKPQTLEFHLIKTCLEASSMCSRWLSPVLGLPCPTSPFPALGMPQVSRAAHVLTPVWCSRSRTTCGPVGLSSPRAHPPVGYSLAKAFAGWRRRTDLN